MSKQRLNNDTGGFGTDDVAVADPSGGFGAGDTPVKDVAVTARFFEGTLFVGIPLIAEKHA